MFTYRHRDKAMVFWDGGYVLADRNAARSMIGIGIIQSPVFP